MSLFRPVVLLVVVMGAGALGGCSSGDPSAAGPTAAQSNQVASARSAPPASPTPDACPSREEIADAVSKVDGSSSVSVSAQVTCDGDWATASMRYPGSDPARVVVRRKGGRVALVTYGTDALCENPSMRSAPAKVKKALGVYC